MGARRVRVRQALGFLDGRQDYSNEMVGTQKGPLTSAFEEQRRGATVACAKTLPSCPDSEEMTGIRFERERVYGYSGGTKAPPG